ncbi:hypothetical protein BDV96DRAFT_607763 [Lophiotrema nucula]|uniref:Uncharacterized protein n=1 Tax=Lophiotrema nucula TaxID=690887 RepID=A0A6A5YGZ0_9PLEO|nr:hypothetical protein BDV96DRAFT_607763 [Lophiotrema nucula]
MSLIALSFLSLVLPTYSWIPPQVLQCGTQNWMPVNDPAPNLGFQNASLKVCRRAVVNCEEYHVDECTLQPGAHALAWIQYAEEGDPGGPQVELINGQTENLSITLANNGADDIHYDVDRCVHMLNLISENCVNEKNETSGGIFTAPDNASWQVEPLSLT